MVTAIREYALVRVTDLRAKNRPAGVCDKCSKTNLRFVHTLQDCDTGERINVGSECAKRLIYGYAPKEMERALKNRYRRREKWLKPWKRSNAGNEWHPFEWDGVRVRVTIVDGLWGGFKYVIAMGGSKPDSPRRAYRTVDEAKLGAYDRLGELLDGW